MKSFTTVAFVVSSLALLVTAQNAQGTANLGNGKGLQFITGVCDSDADCASTCCASGLCSGVDVAAAKGGCGFVASGTTLASSAAPAASTSPATTTTSSGSDTIDENAPGAENVGLGNGSQFITGQCFSNADCASACCASGLCSAVAVAAAKGGCGFVASGVTPPPAASTSAAPPATSSATTTTSSGSDTIDENAAGAQNVGLGNGSQFITGQCFSNADCASACCASGLCSAVAVAASKGGCGFVASGTAAASSAAPAASSAATTTSSGSDTINENEAGAQNVGLGNGSQFITGQCFSDADCASTCCASGSCSAVAVAAAKGGCGFVASKRDFIAFPFNG